MFIEKKRNTDESRDEKQETRRSNFENIISGPGFSYVGSGDYFWEFLGVGIRKFP